MEGAGVDKSAVEGVKYYQLAASQDHPRALFNLGVCHARGEGVEVNMMEAARYFRLAKLNGHSKSQQCLDFISARVDNDEDDGDDGD